MKGCRGTLRGQQEGTLGCAVVQRSTEGIMEGPVGTQKDPEGNL